MTAISKVARELYSNIRSDVIGIHYRRQLIAELFTSEEINELLNRTALRFFTTLKWDLLDTIVIAISRLTDPPKSFRKCSNASLLQLVLSLDSETDKELIRSLTSIWAQIQAKSTRITGWRKKWAAHRDLEIIQGAAPKPAISLVEVDEVLTLIGKFLNEFERVYQDLQLEIDLDTFPLSAEEFDEMERLKIHQPFIYENIHFFPDDGNTIIELIKKANVSPNLNSKTS